MYKSHPEVECFLLVLGVPNFRSNPGQTFQMTLTSCQGILSLLQEQPFQQYAINQLLLKVNTHWSEISDSIPFLLTIPNSSLLVSKLYYHLSDLDLSLDYWLESGENDDQEFVDCLLVVALDRYIDLVREEKSVDEKLLRVVERMFSNCLEHKEYKQV